MAFESITFTNIQTVVIDTGTNDVAGSDADVITIASNLVATGLQSLVITTGSGDDTLQVDIGDPSVPSVGAILRFEGGQGNDTATGTSGSDELIGGTGNDQLSGGFGNDTLTGD